MFKHRLFNILIAVALVMLVVLTAREAFATSSIASQTDAAIDCSSLPSRYSIHSENLRDTGTRLIFTEDGPTGVDGGLQELMSAYRTCSR